MSKISLVINYAGMQVNVFKHESGEFVRLKQISDGAGIDWKNQRRKILGSDWLLRRLGVLEGKLSAENTILGGASTPANSQNSPQNAETRGVAPPSNGESTQKNTDIFIRLDRVAAYLTTINPDQVRSQGNIPAAEYLEAKITEWDDALHEYEEMGVAYNLNHARTKDATRRDRMSFMAACKIREGLSDEKNRKASEHVLGVWAGELGAPYQPDLIDSQGAGKLPLPL